MTYVTWQRQDDVTYAKMCLPSLVTDTMRRFLRLESSKKLQGKNARGGGTHPPLGVRGLRRYKIIQILYKQEAIRKISAAFISYSTIVR